MPFFSGHFRGRERGGKGCGRGGKGGFNRRYQDDEQPEKVIYLGNIMHTCEDDLVIKSRIQEVPYFNAPVFTESKKKIGKIDEIFGSIKDYWVSIKLVDNITSSSFESQQMLFIDPNRVLPLQRFIQQKQPVRPKGNSSFKKGRGSNMFSGNRHFRGNTREQRGRGIRSGRGRWPVRSVTRGRRNNSKF